MQVSSIFSILSSFTNLFPLFTVYFLYLILAKIVLFSISPMGSLLLIFTSLHIFYINLMLLNFILSTTSMYCLNFVVMFLFASKFLIYLDMPPFIWWLFWGVLFNFKILGNFQVTLILLMYSFISLWLKNKPKVLSYF